MSVGTATAIALAASAASNAYAAHAQSSSAKKAAALQAASADKANTMQAQLANQAINAQNQLMYGGTGGTGGTGMPGQGGSAGGGGLQGMYAPYTSSGGATLSALHQFLGIPGADSSQTMVPYGAYGQPMRPPVFGQPQMMAQGYQGASGVPMPQPTAPNTPQGTFLPKVGVVRPQAGQMPGIPMSALYQNRG